ncbi:MAG: copper resistance protein NlpE N-terminal domain-containing protein [Desulfuromonadaceae bacterium]
MRQTQSRVRHGECRIYLMILLASVVFGSGGCTLLPSNNQEVVQPPDRHNSRNALDWSGTYAGTLPCADCSGIRTTLTLSPAHTYVRKSTYLGVESSDAEHMHQGVFEWDSDGRTIELLNLSGGRNLFQVGENRLFALDQSGERVTGDLASAYMLERVEDFDAQDVAAAIDMFVDKAWVLVQLDGASLDEDQAGAAWLQFQCDPQRVYGSSGCNRLTGSWMAGDDAVQKMEQRSPSFTTSLPLHLSPLGTTMMACSSELMQLESKFLSALARVSGVYLDGDELILLDRAARSVARFKARETQ